MSFLETVLLYVILPAWLLAGFGDALCHCAARIETSSGWRESALHWLMLAELAIGVLAVLFLQVNAAVIALFAIVCVAHEVTMVADLGYAHARRDIPPVEQWVHGVQQAIPWIVLLVIAALHPGQALAVLALGVERPNWILEWRDPPLSVGYLSAFAAAAFLLMGLPFAWEAWRTSRPGNGVA